MDDVKLRVGSYGTIQGGQPWDDSRVVEFAGEKKAQRTEYTDERGNRGRTETLYQAGGKLVVHVKVWSRWQGEADHLWVEEVTEKDLAFGGDFEKLGIEARYGRPLTLEEALAAYGRVPEL